MRIFIQHELEFANYTASFAASAAIQYEVDRCRGVQEQYFDFHSIPFPMTSISFPSHNIPIIRLSFIPIFPTAVFPFPLTTNQSVLVGLMCTFGHMEIRI